MKLKIFLSKTTDLVELWQDEQVQNHSPLLCWFYLLPYPLYWSDTLVFGEGEEKIQEELIEMNGRVSWEAAGRDGFSLLCFLFSFSLFFYFFFSFFPTPILLIFPLFLFLQFISLLPHPPNFSSLYQ